MPVLLDLIPLTTIEPTLSAAISAARAAAESNRRVITEILLDGHSVTDDALSGPTGARPLSPDADLRFITADPVELVQASLRDAAAALDRIDPHQRAAATAIQTGQFDKAIPDLSEAFTIWETARKVLTDGCGLLGLNVDTLTVQVAGSPVAVSGAIRMLIARLTEVKRCLTMQDWCGLSDVLAYDLPADSELWRAMLRGLADKLPELR